jgi:glycosyltransferase involved in cell wall biosynthesis
MKNSLCIITNESISLNEGVYRCDNIDMKSIPESLKEDNFDTSMIARKSKFKRAKNINLTKIKIYNNIFSYIYGLAKFFKNRENKYLIVSISPYTFFAVILLRLFKKKPFVYLRSDGYEEYKSILGFYGPLIYHLMFLVVAKFSLLIACRKHLLRKKSGNVVNPSQLNTKWFVHNKKKKTVSNSLLYIGRIRIEKGIFSLIKIIKDSKLNLTIVTAEKEDKTIKKSNNISIINFKNKDDQIIKFYDEHNIFILPSYTEAHPQVLDEALARNIPVIIFKEISHVIRNRKGVFVSERNIKSLQGTVDHINKNYQDIQNQIKLNILPTKKKFIEELKNIILTK